jgi:hypothetical protein
MDHQAIAEMLGNYGEFLGAIAVAATLAYLAVQVGQSKAATEVNTTALHTSSTHALEAVYFQSIANFSSTSENAGLIDRGNKDYASLSDEEKFHFGLMHYNHCSVIEIIYFQFKRGLVNLETAQRAMQALQFYRRQSGFDDFWNTVIKHYLQPDFVAAVDSGELVRDLAALPTNMSGNTVASSQ